MKETYNMKNEKDFNENELKPFRGDYNKCGYYRIRNNLRTSEHVQSVRTAKFSQLNEAILA